MNEIVEGAKTEFASQSFNLQKLYEVTSNELERVKERLDEVEKKGRHNGKGKFLNPKHMLPRTLDDQEDWKQWKSQVEDYCEVVMDGTKEILEVVRNNTRAIKTTNAKVKWWNIRAEIWRLLNIFTSG